MGLKMREIGFQRTYIFKIFRASMPPDPPRKVRLRRTITFSITYEHPLENLSYAPVYSGGELAMGRNRYHSFPKVRDSVYIRLFHEQHAWRVGIWPSLKL